MYTRDEAREYFAERKLTYADITPGAIGMLELMINAEFAEEKVKSNGSIWYWDRVNSRGKGSRRVISVLDKNNVVKGLYFRASGSHFESREAISFNLDGFIGFCGEADNHNCQPVIRAFMRWCDWLMNERLRASSLIEGYADQSGLAPAT